MPEGERRHDIDWLRVIAVFLLLVAHCTRPFDTEPWHVHDTTSSVALERCADFLRFWRMPLLFLVSGFGTHLALGVRSGAQYARDRVTRLLVPLVVGMAIVVPPQVYMERISTGNPMRMSPIDFRGSFGQFYLHHAFEGIYPNGNLSWHHLWFLAYLLVFSVAALPLFLWLRGPSGRARLERLGAFLARGRNVLLLALPTALLEILLHERWPVTHDLIHDWANFAHSFALFLYGYLLAAYPGFRPALDRNRVLALGLGIGCGGILLSRISFQEMFSGAWLPAYVVRRLLIAFNEWCWIVAILGFAQAYLAKSNALLRHANTLVYPFYIWHQTVIVVLAFFVVHWSANVLMKFAVLTVASFVVTVALCELVRLTAVTRFMFGIKLPRKVIARSNNADRP